MEMLNEVGNGIKHVIIWISMVFESLRDSLGIPEWVPITVAIIVIVAIISSAIRKGR